ncbi:hypothetical protein ACGFJT_42285 [Actinomadura geliboluensis]|uniref:hypothetical protein n=1 Tax=Actinomadura geliboluensis TaxID=882440 RepID=UPI00371DA874
MVDDRGRLRFVGRVGTGFTCWRHWSSRSRRWMMCPAAWCRGVRWVRPALVGKAVLAE